MAATDYDFNLTRTEIIDRAFRIIGVLSPGNSMGGDEQEQGRIVLNAMVSRWQSDHIFLWCQDTVTQALSDNTQTYTLPTDKQVLTVDKAFLRNGNNDTPIEIIGWDQFQELSPSNNAGDPSFLAVDYTPTGGTIYTWPTIGTAGSKSLFMLCTVKLKDFDTSIANPDLRAAWLDALSYGLAANLQDEYSLPISEREYNNGKATQFYNTAKKTDVKRPDYLCVRGAYE